jgi:hypothetical protein
VGQILLHHSTKNEQKNLKHGCKLTSAYTLAMNNLLNVGIFFRELWDEKYEYLCLWQRADTTTQKGKKIQI